VLNNKIDPSLSIPKSSGADLADRIIQIAPAPLLHGERQADYDNLVSRIVAVAKPLDAIEEFLARDVIDLTWEILRLRRLKAALLRASTGRGVRKVLESLGYGEDQPFGFAREVAARWAAAEKETRKEVQRVLDKAQLTMDDVMAKTLDSEIGSFERFDRMLASAEARRNSALREIDRHREALGAQMRKAYDEVQDAEFREVETGILPRGSRS
jgi:hypothetical protein